MNPSVRQAISSIPANAWTTIRYPNAIWDEDEQRWISEAEVAETTFTAFTSHPKKRQIPCRLVVCRVERLNKATLAAAEAGQDQLFTTWRHHRFVTNSTLTAVAADETHRNHAIIEQVIAELKSGPHAHTPSGKFTANAAWLTLACLAFNLRRAAGAAVGSSCAYPPTGPGLPRGKTSGPPPPPPDRHGPSGPEEAPNVEEPHRPADPPHPHPTRRRITRINSQPRPQKSPSVGSGLI